MVTYSEFLCSTLSKSKNTEMNHYDQTRISGSTALEWSHQNVFQGAHIETMCDVSQTINVTYVRE